MKIPIGTPPSPLVPTTGDICIDAINNTLYHCPIDGNWVNANTGDQEILTYGSACLYIGGVTQWHDYPGSTPLPPHLHAQSPNMYESFSLVANSFFDILEIENDGTVRNMWTNLSFSAPGEITAFVRANFTENALPDDNRPMYNAYIRIYDIVDSGIPRLEKMYGANRFYSMLEGRNRTRDMAYLPAVNHWADFGPWFENLCNRTAWLPPGTLYTPGVEKMLWVATDRRTRYGLPADGWSIYHGIPNGPSHNRNVWDSGSGNQQSVGPLFPEVFRNSPVEPNQVYCSLYLDDPGLASWDWWDYPSHHEIAQVKWDTRSTVVVYFMENQVDLNKRAFLIKPIGIDMVGLNWFDDTKYDLCALHTRRNTYPRSYTCSPTVPAPNSLPGQTNDLYWTSKYGWATGLLDMQSVAGGENSIRFFLRDKTTNFVSRVTKSRIKIVN